MMSIGRVLFTEKQLPPLLPLLQLAGQASDESGLQFLQVCMAREGILLYLPLLMPVYIGVGQQISMPAMLIFPARHPIFMHLLKDLSRCSEFSTGLQVHGCGLDTQLRCW